MAEFAADIQDWSLQAIVRGSSGDFAKIVDRDMDVQESVFDISGNHRELDREFLDSLPEILGLSHEFVDELEELYKPFYRVVPPSLPAKTTLEFQDRRVKDLVADNEQTHDQTDTLSGTNWVAKDHPAAYAPKYKRRKNQHKRVVTQVSAEGLASDMWAWRKYGQKPIKGSPYPRSYYRCSSSKGCLARKQVEQSCMDPGMFIITYTAEHNHSQPTRRNSLAGTVRQKFPSPRSPTTKTHVKQEKTDDSNTSAGSPITLPDHEMDLSQEKFRQEKKEELGKRHDDDDTNEFRMLDWIFDGDFFSGLEDFDDFDSELPVSQQFPVRSCS